MTPLSYLQYGGHILGLEKQLYGEFILHSSELVLCTVKGMRVCIHALLTFVIESREKRRCRPLSGGIFCYCVERTKFFQVPAAHINNYVSGGVNNTYCANVYVILCQ